MNATETTPRSLLTRPEFIQASEEGEGLPPVRPRVATDALRARIRNVDPSLDPASSTFRAALVLLAGLEAGQNVDRVTRLTRSPRPLVAKYMRRLVDNGVWRGRETIADWTGEGPEHPAFWKDVAVAEGKLCRRMDEEGAIEWAAPGEWHKSYDFVEREPHTDTCVRYYVPAPVEAGMLDESSEAEAAPDPEPASSPEADQTAEAPALPEVPSIEDTAAVFSVADIAEVGTDGSSTSVTSSTDSHGSMPKHPVRGWRAARRIPVLAQNAKSAPVAAGHAGVTADDAEDDADLGVGGMFPDTVWIG